MAADPIVVGSLIGAVHAVNQIATGVYIAWFRSRADAEAFVRLMGSERYIIDHADIARVPGDHAAAARALAKEEG